MAKVKAKTFKTQNKIETGYEFRKADVDHIIKVWNSIGGLSKVRGTENLRSHIIGALKRNTLDKICNSIRRYGTLFNDESYFFKYKWTLQGFLSKRDIIDRFNDNGSLWFAYKSWKSEAVPQKAKAEVDDNKYIPVENYENVLNYLKSMNYQDYLYTEHWRHFIKEAVKFARSRCQLCDREHVMLHVHHKRYDNRGRETFNDIIVLCEECHKMVHNKPLHENTQKTP